MATKTSPAENGKASTIKKTFSRTTSVGIEINANASIIWALLTDAPGYPRWNSSVISIDGRISPGEKIKLKSTLDPKRIFKLKVKEFFPDKKLAWGDAMGQRTYTLDKRNNQSTLFSMIENIGGPLFPLFAKMIPPFDKPFEQFAIDLKKETESIMNTK